MKDEERISQPEKQLAELLKRSLPPVDRELNLDLWPQMLRRLEEHPRQPNWLAALLSPAAMASVPWFDWALLAALVVGVCLFPRSIPIWLYHF